MIIYVYQIDKMSEHTHFDLLYFVIRKANICQAEIFILANILPLLFSWTSSDSFLWEAIFFQDISEHFVHELQNHIVCSSSIVIK